jgi:putative oxidoreductase
MKPTDSVWADRLLSVLRIVTAALFMVHGTQKLFNIPPSGIPGFPVSPASLLGAASILEIVGGFLLLIGLFTRPVAFVLAGEMAVAYFKAHAPQGFLPIMNHGELPVLLCFLFLYLSAAGGGRWSLDAVLNARRTKGIDAAEGGPVLRDPRGGRSDAAAMRPAQ